MKTPASSVAAIRPSARVFIRASRLPVMPSLCSSRRKVFFGTGQVNSDVDSEKREGINHSFRASEKSSNMATQNSSHRWDQEADRSEEHTSELQSPYVIS